MADKNTPQHITVPLLGHCGTLFAQDTPALSDIHITADAISSDCIGTLQAVLARSPTLTSWGLTCTHVTDETLTYIDYLLSSNHLRRLHLDLRDASPTAVAALVLSLSQSHELQELTLQNACFGSYSFVSRFASTIRTLQQLERLDVFGSSIAHSLRPLFARMVIHHPALKAISLFEKQPNREYEDLRALGEALLGISAQQMPTVPLYFSASGQINVAYLIDTLALNQPINSATLTSASSSQLDIPAPLPQSASISPTALLWSRSEPDTDSPGRKGAHFFPEHLRESLFESTRTAWDILPEQSFDARVDWGNLNSFELDEKVFNIFDVEHFNIFYTANETLLSITHHIPALFVVLLDLKSENATVESLLMTRLQKICSHCPLHSKPFVLVVCVLGNVLVSKSHLMELSSSLTRAMQLFSSSVSFIQSPQGEPLFIHGTTSRCELRATLISAHTKLSELNAVKALSASAVLLPRLQMFRMSHSTVVMCKLEDLLTGIDPDSFTDSELLAALHHLTLLGEIYFDEASPLQNFVVLDMQWFYDEYLGWVVCPPHAQSASLRSSCSAFRLLAQQGAVGAWQLPANLPTITNISAISVVKHLQLCFEYKTVDEDSGLPVEKYVFPTLLRSVPDKETWSSNASFNTHVGLRFGSSERTRALPPLFFGRLQDQLAQKISGEGGHHRVWGTSMWCALGDVEAFVTLQLPEASAVQVHVRGNQDTKLSSLRLLLHVCQSIELAAQLFHDCINFSVWFLSQRDLQIYKYQARPFPLRSIIDARVNGQQFISSPLGFSESLYALIGLESHDDVRLPATESRFQLGAIVSSTATIVSLLSRDVARLSGRVAQQVDVPVPVMSPAASRLRKIERSQIKNEEVIGQGHFSVVSKALFVNHVTNLSQVVVVKQCKEAVTAEPEKLLENEALILSQMHHARIVGFLGVVYEAGVLSMLIEEFCESGDLLSYLRGTNVSRSTMATITGDVAEGLAYLAWRGFVHRDIAARNIMLTAECRAKIADFGLSQELVDSEYFRSPRGEIAIRWAAPECIESQTFSIMSDVWSFGILLYELWSHGAHPFPRLQGFDILRALKAGERLRLPQSCPVQVQSALQACCRLEPHERPAMHALAAQMRTLNTQSGPASEHEYLDLMKNPSCTPPSTPTWQKFEVNHNFVDAVDDTSPPRTRPSVEIVLTASPACISEFINVPPRPRVETATKSYPPRSPNGPNKLRQSLIRAAGRTSLQPSQAAAALTELAEEAEFLTSSSPNRRSRPRVGRDNVVEDDEELQLSISPSRTPGSPATPFEGTTRNAEFRAPSYSLPRRMKLSVPSDEFEEFSSGREFSRSQTSLYSTRLPPVGTSGIPREARTRPKAESNPASFPMSRLVYVFFFCLFFALSLVTSATLVWCFSSSNSLPRRIRSRTAGVSDDDSVNTILALRSEGDTFV
eukprot:m.388396 g.388396  ORF g.388396 m.388396 type:complete len:1432 (-) comp56325_c0_seq8:1983-6278(-)